MESLGTDWVVSGVRTALPTPPTPRRLSPGKLPHTVPGGPQHGPLLGLEDSRPQKARCPVQPWAVSSVL